MNDIVRMPQQNSGSRLSDMPGARMRNIVTMKLMPPIVVEMPRKVTPIAQKSSPSPDAYSDDDNGVYANQPASGMSCTTNEPYMSRPENR